MWAVRSEQIQRQTLKDVSQNGILLCIYLHTYSDGIRFHSVATTTIHSTLSRFSIDSSLLFLGFHNQAELVIGDQTLYYEYNAQVDNINLRTLQSFSTKVKDVVGDFWTLDIFSKFFGSYDYADMIIMGAFDGLDVGFPQGNESIPGGPKLDLSSYNREHGIAGELSEYSQSFLEYVILTCTPMYHTVRFTRIDT
jgi:hypothetical protein